MYRTIHTHTHTYVHLYMRLCRPRLIIKAVFFKNSFSCFFVCCVLKVKPSVQETFKFFIIVIVLVFIMPVMK